MDLGKFFGKKFDFIKVPFLKFILLKNYLAQKAENVINVTRTLAEQNKKTVCQNGNRFLRYSHLKNGIFRRRRANETAPTVVSTPLRIRWTIPLTQQNVGTGKTATSRTISMYLLFIIFHSEYHTTGSFKLSAINGTVLYYRYTEIYPELATGGVVPVTRKSTFFTF